MKILIRNNKVIIDGYVNAVERFSKQLRDKDGKFIEKILPNVFQRALDKNDDVKVLLNHDKKRELATTKDDSAKLYEDSIGLRALVEISDAEVIKKAEEGKLRGWSFGFIPRKTDKKINADGLEERIIQELDLLEVSIIDDQKTPAYIATSIELREEDIDLVEYRDGEFDDAIEEKEIDNDFQKLTNSQKREILQNSFYQIVEEGYLEDFDDNFIYGIVEKNLYKIPYKIENNEVKITIEEKVKVIRGSYEEIREEKKPEQFSEKNVEKINYSKYEYRIKKLRRKKYGN